MSHPVPESPATALSTAYETRPLRVAYLSGSPRIATRDDAEVSGPRAHILGLIEALRADGHTVDEFILGNLIEPRVSGAGSRRLVTGGRARQFGVDLARLGLRTTLPSRAARTLPGEFDLVYERYALFQHLGRPFQRSGAPWVVETNAVISQEARLERNALALQSLAGRLERKTYAEADLVVCVSETLREALVEHAGMSAEDVAVIPNGVDIERFRGASRPAGDVAAPDELVVGFVGFVIERQGLDELVHAVSELRRGGLAVRAVIVGDGPDRQRLMDVARRAGVAEAVSFPGQARWQDVPAWIERFSVGFSGQRGVGGMPMYHSPLKIYEYLAMSRPVVASHHRDAETTLIASGGGWTFPAGDRDALVATLTEVADTGPAGLTERGRLARAHVEREHTWRARQRQLLGELHSRGLLT